MIRILLVMAFALVLPSLALAHELRPAYLEILETSASNYAVTWKVPARGDMRLALHARLPASCISQQEPVRSVENNAYFERWSSVCEGGLKGETIRIEGLNSTLTDVLVRITHMDGSVELERLQGTSTAFVVKGSQTAGEVATTYVWLGIEHILAGLDHLLFVLSLLLLRADPRTLIKTITAFTVAHSVTLSGAALGYLSLPQQPVEVLIACSIAFVAAEIAKSKPGTQRLSQQRPWLIAFAFGLLHGFGFAGALSEIGLPQTDIPLALFSFNIGVEAGQLIFVAACLLFAKAAVTVITFSARHFRRYASYLIGSVAAGWMLLRLGALVS
jgi:hydrogenase/urease accessory protein HupE